MVAQLDRRKHDFDVLEHVLGGMQPTAEGEDCGLVTSEVHRPESLSDADYEISVEVERGREADTPTGSRRRGSG